MLINIEPIAFLPNSGPSMAGLMLAEKAMAAALVQVSPALRTAATLAYCSLLPFFRSP